MRNAGGYSLYYNGRNIQITVLDCVEDYKMLAPQLAYSENYVYYIYRNNIFVYQNNVIASGDFNYISEEYEGLTLDEWIIKQKLKEEVEDASREMFYGIRNRRKYTYEEKIEERPIEEVKEENPEFEIEKIESMGFKTADTNETVMEISVPTADELDSYFSSIGYSGGIYD